MRTLSVFLFLTFILFEFTSLSAQIKVVGRSKKNEPAWISSSETGFVVIRAEGKTLEESKDNAIGLTKNKLLEIAYEYMLAENTQLDLIKIDSLKAIEEVKNTVFYKNLDAEEFYWEKKKDKETKNVSFTFYLNFHQENEERTKSIKEFARNYELTASLDSLAMRVKHFKTVEDLNKVWRNLMLLNPEFADADIRKDKCEKILSQAEANFKNIEVKEMLNTPGKLIVTQTFNDRGIVASRQPIVKSNCAKITRIENYLEQWSIHYAYNKCSKAFPNSINVEFINSYNSLSDDFKIDVNKEELEIKVSSANIVIEQKKMATIYIASMYRGNLIVDRIILRFNDLNFTDTKMNQLFEGPGMYTIGFSLPPDFNKVKIDDKIRGEVHYKSQKTGQRGVYRFYNQNVVLY